MAWLVFIFGPDSLDGYHERVIFIVVCSLAGFDGLDFLVRVPGNLHWFCGLDILNYDNNMFQDNLGDNFKLIDTYNYLYTHPSNGNTRKYIYSLFKRK